MWICLTGTSGCGAGTYKISAVNSLSNPRCSSLWSSRRIAPLLLGGMGSDSCFIPGDPKKALWCKKSWGMGGLQGARFESLDNRFTQGFLLHSRCSGFLKYSMLFILESLNNSPMYDPPANYSMWNQRYFT